MTCPTEKHSWTPKVRRLDNVKIKLSGNRSNAATKHATDDSLRPSPKCGAFFRFGRGIVHGFHYQACVAVTAAAVAGIRFQFCLAGTRIYGCYSRLANRSQIQLGFVKQIYFTDTTRVWPLSNIPLYSNKDS
ncbi:unnamed protein product [Macrosiphum euphorbiae]|uniref:Uncharacterized protein n=1 Tax=Macrosiphum euphorbiae TaxID=13131 RepID=A0AAV0XL63_9HEMI|nr:unnamed protein product [Macrosiphum euphorbiae]